MANPLDDDAVKTFLKAFAADDLKTMRAVIAGRAPIIAEPTEERLRELRIPLELSQQVLDDSAPIDLSIKETPTSQAAFEPDGPAPDRHPPDPYVTNPLRYQQIWAPFLGDAYNAAIGAITGAVLGHFEPSFTAVTTNSHQTLTPESIAALLADLHAQAPWIRYMGQVEISTAACEWLPPGDDRTMVIDVWDLNHYRWRPAERYRVITTQITRDYLTEQKIAFDEHGAFLVHMARELHQSEQAKRDDGTWKSQAAITRAFNKAIVP